MTPPRRNRMSHSRRSNLERTATDASNAKIKQEYRVSEISCLQNKSIPFVTVEVTVCVVT